MLQNYCLLSSSDRRLVSLSVKKHNLLIRKNKSRTALCDLDEDRPRQSGCLASRPVTFCPCLAAGLALISLFFEIQQHTHCPTSTLSFSQPVALHGSLPSRGYTGPARLLGSPLVRVCGNGVEIVTIQMPDQAIILPMAVSRLIHLVVRYSTSH